jgi:hypothetical protein
MNDRAMLTDILTHHVVGQKPAPEDLEDGCFDTLRKPRLTTSGSDESPGRPSGSWRRCRWPARTR